MDYTPLKQKITRIRKKVAKNCPICSKVFLVRQDYLKKHLGYCTSCIRSITSGGKGNCYNTCYDCGKVSKWIKLQSRCSKCLIKFRFQIKENHPKYITDRGTLKKSEKKHLDTNYKYWMLSVKKRDNWKCKIGNQDCKGKMEAHHILRWSDYPELRYDINNGITLCKYHHPIKKSEESLLSPFFTQLVNKN